MCELKWQHSILYVKTLRRIWQSYQDPSFFKMRLFPAPADQQVSLLLAIGIFMSNAGSVIAGKGGRNYIRVLQYVTILLCMLCYIKTTTFSMYTTAFTTYKMYRNVLYSTVHCCSGSNLDISIVFVAHGAWYIVATSRVKSMRKLTDSLYL